MGYGTPRLSIIKIKGEIVVSTCPINYKWVRVPRSLMPDNSKGLMKDYFKIAFASAYKDGIVKYCGYENTVKANQWVGGVAGLKRMLNRRTRDITLDALFLLQEYNFVSTFFERGGKITIDFFDLVNLQNCSLKERVQKETEEYISLHRDDLSQSEIENLQRYALEFNEKCYVNDNSGFICVPRNLTQRLVDIGYVFDDADAFYDLYLHTVYNYGYNPFSEKCPVVMYDENTSVITLDVLGQRWGWSKTKVSRFFKKFDAYFSLVKLQSSYGCVVFNKVFQTDTEFTVPTQQDCFDIVNHFKSCGDMVYAYEDLMYSGEIENCSENTYINCCINNFAGFEPDEDLLEYYNNCYAENCTNEPCQTDSIVSVVKDCFFDAEKCVLQFLQDNKYSLLRKEFLFNLTATAHSSLSNLLVNSNNTYNIGSCPTFRTTERLDKRSLSISEPLPQFLTGNSSQGLKINSVLQFHNSTTYECSPHKRRDSRIIQTLKTFISKITTLFKGAKCYE